MTAMTPTKVEEALVLAICDADGGRSPPHSYERMAKAALSVLTEALAERGWRPIESAPRDSEQVLIFDPTLGAGFICVARYWMGEWRHGSLPGDTMFPTYWQPLPEPPHDR